MAQLAVHRNQSARSVSFKVLLQVACSDCEATPTVVTSAKPIMIAPAVVVVRLGERAAFSVESLPVTREINLIGQPITFARLAAKNGLSKFTLISSATQPMAKAIHCSPPAKLPTLAMTMKKMPMTKTAQRPAAG